MKSGSLIDPGLSRRDLRDFRYAQAIVWCAWQGINVNRADKRPRRAEQGLKNEAFIHVSRGLPVESFVPSTSRQ